MTCTRAEWPAFSPLVTVPRRMIGSCTCGRSVDLGQLWLSTHLTLMFGLKRDFLAFEDAQEASLKCWPEKSSLGAAKFVSCEL